MGSLSEVWQVKYRDPVGGQNRVAGAGRSARASHRLPLQGPF